MVLPLLIAPLSRGATLWTGPVVNWTKSTGNPSDTILPGKVVLTRGSRDVLYNTAAGETFATIGANSPLDTEWAFGTLANYASLTYQSMESMRSSGDIRDLILDQPMVMHIKNEDIYMSITFVDWGRFGSGTVSYNRSTPAAANPPSVTMTNPAPGAVFAAPANVKLGASASVSGGTVTNVTFRNNTTVLGSVQSSPFNLTASNLAAGAFALNAVATAGGLSSTSATVNITIVTPAAVTLTSPHIGSGLFSFNYSANAGLSYVVQRSSNFVNWVSIATNVASGSSVPFSESVVASPPRVYRVGRLPNP